MSAPPASRLIALAALLCAGCSGPQDRRGTEDAPAASTWTSAVEFSTLGMDTLQLRAGGPLFARFLDNGSLAIANGPSIVSLSREGAFENVLARSGDGPGEFRVILGLGIAEDGSLFASDFLTGRLTQLTAGGDFLRVIGRLRPFAADMEASPFAMLSDGRTLAVPWQWRAARVPSPAAGTSITRDQVAVVVYDGQGEVSDTIATLQGLERSDGFVVPFARSAVYSGRGRRWVAGITDSLDLTLYDGTTPQARLVAPRAGAPPTDRQRSQRDSAVMAQFSGETGEAVIKRQASGARPATAPDIGGVLIDAAGRLWIGKYIVPGESQREWSIYSPGGEPLGRLSLPAFGGDALLPSRTELLDAADGRVALVRESADGELFIEVRRITAR